MAELNSDDLIAQARQQVEHIRNRQAENDELLGKLDSIKDRLGALEAKATSADGTVTVVAGSGGIVRSVQLTDDAMRATAAELTSSINTAVGRAIAEATRLQLEIVREVAGAGIETDRILGPQAKLASYAEREDADAGAAAGSKGSGQHDDASDDPMANLLRRR